MASPKSIVAGKSDDKKHSLIITMTQTTDGEKDGGTLVEEYSDDSMVHVIKCKVFAAEITKAIAAAVDQLTDMAIGEMSGGKK
jgi:hypothetical protein